MIIIPGQSGTYRHSRRRVTGLLADSGQIANNSQQAHSYSELAFIGPAGPSHTDHQFGRITGSHAGDQTAAHIGGYVRA
jgi:hypothetical protein